MAQPQGVSLAFTADTLDPNPTWTRLDAGVTRVASYTIDRGREFELDQTDGGRAEVTINDVDGTLDPTNSSGPYYTLLEPLIQAAIARYNPVTATWHTRFRGFVADYDYDFDPSQQVNRLRLSLVDIFEILNQVEMLPGQFGDPSPPPPSKGQVWFDNHDVNDRIDAIYAAVGLDPAFHVTFSGNVLLYESTYSPGESALTAIQEAADAEFPGVSNYFPDRFGRACFHGRLAKFDPVGVAASTTADRWDYQEWKAGDRAAVLAALSTTAQIREFSFNRGISKVLNQALATPVNIADADVAGQLAQDLTSIGLRGVRSWTKQDLLTKVGNLNGNDALTETKLFATYIVDNYAEPRNRVTRLAFKAMRPDDPRAAANWKLLSRCDIADRIDISVASPGGGGFNLEPFFIEGVHEEVNGRLLNGTVDDVTLSLDVSPMAYFDTNPFPTS